MIFRVMRENEIEDKGLGMGIYSKKFNIDVKDNFEAALNNITTHITNGNNAITEYISCSKNFCLDLEKYATEQIELRPYLALISNHDKSTIQCNAYDVVKERLYLHKNILNRLKTDNLTIEQYKKLVNEDILLSSVYEDLDKRTDLKAHCIRKEMAFYVNYPKTVLASLIFNIPQSDIKKMVIDASDNIYLDVVYKELFDFGLIHNKNGEKKERFNQWEYGTARNSREVLILNHVSINDIQTLNPLQYDILYTLIQFTCISNIDFETINMLSLFKEENYYNIRSLLQNSSERYVFDSLYIQRKSILNISEDITTFRNVIKLKIEIIKKCIQYLNFKLNKNYYNEAAIILEQSIMLNECSTIKLQGDKILKKVS